MILQAKTNRRVARRVQTFQKLYPGPSNADDLQTSGAHGSCNLHPDERRPINLADAAALRLPCHCCNLSVWVDAEFAVTLTQTGESLQR